jgi:hypothetical protein
MSVMPLLHQLRVRSYQMTVFHLSFSKEFVPSFVYALYKLGQTGRLLRNSVCAFENCEDRLLAPLCLSVGPTVWNKSTSPDFLEILYCGVVVVDINSVMAIRVCLKIGQS